MGRCGAGAPATRLLALQRTRIRAGKSSRSPASGSRLSVRTVSRAPSAPTERSPARTTAGPSTGCLQRASSNRCRSGVIVGARYVWMRLWRVGARRMMTRRRFCRPRRGSSRLCRSPGLSRARCASAGRWCAGAKNRPAVATGRPPRQPDRSGQWRWTGCSRAGCVPMARWSVGASARIQSETLAGTATEGCGPKARSPRWLSTRVGRRSARCAPAGTSCAGTTAAAPTGPPAASSSPSTPDPPPPAGCAPTATPPAGASRLGSACIAPHSPSIGTSPTGRSPRSASATATRVRCAPTAKRHAGVAANSADRLPASTRPSRNARTGGVWSHHRGRSPPSARSTSSPAGCAPTATPPVGECKALLPARRWPAHRRGRSPLSKPETDKPAACAPTATPDAGSVAAVAGPPAARRPPSPTAPAPRRRTRLRQPRRRPGTQRARHLLPIHRILPIRPIDRRQRGAQLRAGLSRRDLLLVQEHHLARTHPAGAVHRRHRRQHVLMRHARQRRSRMLDAPLATRRRPRTHNRDNIRRQHSPLTPRPRPRLRR